MVYIMTKSQMKFTCVDKDLLEISALMQILPPIKAHLLGKNILKKIMNRQRHQLLRNKTAFLFRLLMPNIIRITMHVTNNMFGDAEMLKLKMDGATCISQRLSSVIWHGSLWIACHILFLMKRWKSNKSKMDTMNLLRNSFIITSIESRQKRE